MILDARPLVEEKVAELKATLDEMKMQGMDVPTLTILRVGGDPASAKYVANKVKLCERVGINSEVIHLPEDVTEDEVAFEISKLNMSARVTGILLQLPLPKHLNEKKLTEMILPEKDVDGFTTANLGKLVTGDRSPRACTPSGILTLLDYYGVELEGKDVLIVNRSVIVGKPLALMMLEKNATVTVAHSKTKDLRKKIYQADVVVLGVGMAKFVGAPHFKEGAVIVDVSINFDEETGKLCGDVCKADYELLSSKGCKVTPVPFGVGQTTVLALIEQTLRMGMEKCSLE